LNWSFFVPALKGDSSFAEMIFDSRGLQARRKKLESGVRLDARAAVADVTRAAEKDLEAATRAATKGNLWRAWTSEVYPRSGQADNPAGVVYVKGRDRTRGAIRAYTKGASITGKRGQFLAVPLPAAGRRGTGRNFKDITPRDWERRTGLKLRPVFRRGKPGLLVLDEGKVGKTGFARGATERQRERGRGVSTVPIFILLPVVNVRQRFSIEQTVAPQRRRLESEFLSRFVRRANEGVTNG
jgi:hypothetical protein